MIRMVSIGVITSGLLLAGCASTPDDPNRHTKEKAAAGAALGAIAGAIVGYQGDHSGGALRGALVGAAAGGALGAGVGAYMDKQQAEFEYAGVETSEAVRFLVKIKEAIENPTRLMLEI